MTESLKQETIRLQLSEQFKIDPERILFLNDKNPDEPWLPAEALVTIARQSDNFQTLDEGFDQFIAPLNQIVHRATVIDRSGRTYSRCAVATIGERQDADAHALAAGRAMGAALTAAGFNPLRPGAVITIDLKLTGDTAGMGDEAQTRNADLKRIHAIAVRKSLIKPLPGGGRDMVEYRRKLMEKYGVNSAASFDAPQRASLINYLEQLPDDLDEFADIAA